ncbi:MAG: TonB-dependent receptor [Pedobacter sp.]|nr:TonB-dependent receptor [Pedobacter sp.]
MLLFKTHPLAASIARALGFAGSAGLLLSLSTAVLAEENAAAAPAEAVVATPDAAAAAETSATTEAATPAVKSRQLDTVVVTAQRRKENLQKVPAAITAISGNKLQDDGVGRAANDVIKYVPNASAATSGGHTRPRWWIRGVGTGTQGLDSPSPIGVYLDDVYISNANATGFPVFDLERVEVLRGPQGTLWGKNTTGGAVNFVSKKPKYDSDGFARIDYGSHDNLLIEGAGGGTIIPEKLAARASFHQETRDGAYENAKTGAEDGGFSDTAGRVQFQANITPDFEALLNVHVRDYQVEGNTATVLGRGVGGAYWTNGATYIPSTDRYAVSANAQSGTDISQKGANLNLKWQLNKLELTSITAFEGFEQEVFSDSDSTPLELSRGHSAGKSSQTSQEFRLASPREDRWNWVTGLHYFNENIRSDSASGTLLTGDLPTTRAQSYNDTFYTHETRSYAIFGSSTFNFTDAFALTAGLRWSSEEKSIDLKRFQATGVTTATAQIFRDPTKWWLLNGVSGATVVQNVKQNASNSWSDWSYDLTPEYRITENQRAYFHFARGFRGGGYNTSVNVQADVNVLNPEYLTSYELGYKSEWAEGRLNFNANVFHYDYEDMQVNYVVSSATGPSSQLKNAAEGSANGAEIEIEALPISNLRIKGGFGWLATNFDEFLVPNSPPLTGNKNLAGNDFVRSPHFTGVINIDYRVPLANGDDIVLGTDWNYTTKFYFFTNNQTDSQLWQDPYAVGNVRASYVTADNKLNVTAYVNNVTDEQYKQHTLPGTNGATGNIVYWAEGLTGGLSLTTRW